PAVARALRARRRDDRAEALALRAGTRGHDLAQEGPRHLRHLTAPAAHVTGLSGGTGRRAFPVAGRADDRRVDLDVLRGAEGRLVELDLQPDHGVLAAAGARARPALRRRTEERVHDVREVPEAAGAEAARAAARLGQRVTAEVVDLLLLRVRQHLVGGVDLLEALLRLRIG